MQIRTRLLVSFLLLTVLIVVQAVFSSYVAQQQDSLVRQMVHEHEISNRLSGLALAAQKIRRYEKEYFIYVADEARRSHYFSEFQSAKGEIDSYLRALHRIYSVDANEAERQRIAAWQDAADFYADQFDNIQREVNTGKITTPFAANAAIAEGKNRFRQVLTDSHAAIDRQLELARANSDAIFAYKADSSTLFALLSALSVLFGLFISYQVPRSICKPVRELTELADGISKGRINVPVKVTGSREIEELAKSIERLRVAVRGLLLRVQRPKKARLEQAG